MADKQIIEITTWAEAEVTKAADVEQDSSEQESK